MDEAKETPSASPRIPLRLKLGLLTTLLATAPLPVVGLVLVGVAQSALERETRELQLAVSDDVAGSLERQLAEAQDGLDTVGRLLTGDQLDADQAIVAASRAVEGHVAIDHVALYDAQGNLIDVIRESGAPELPHPEHLDAALRARADEHGVTNGEPIEDDVAPRVPVVIPLRPTADAASTGYAVSLVSLRPFQARVERISARRFGEQDGAVMVVDAEPRVLASGDPEQVWTMANDHALLASIRGTRFGTAFAEQRIFEGRSEEMLGTLVSIPSLGWGVLVQLPTRVAFASIHQMQRVIAGTSLLVVLIALAAGLWVARSITAPIRALVDLAQRLGRRELGATVRIWTSDELKVLGDALSKASTDLRDGEDRIRKEEAIRGDLGRYLPGEIVDRVVRREQDMGLGGVRREITVLFADVVAFTPLTESKEPEVVVAILNELFTILTEIVFRHGGTVDKFIGDAVMGMWGAPEPQEDHAERAVAAAEDMLRWLEMSNESWRERYGVDIKLAIGIHTGPAIVGNVGSETRMTYTAIGDVVNVAARLEAIARPQQILLTAATREAAGEGFEYIDAGERELAGRSGTVHLYAVHA